MLFGNPLVERGGLRAKCKANVAARILADVKEVKIVVDEFSW